MIRSLLLTVVPLLASSLSLGCAEPPIRNRAVEKITQTANLIDPSHYEALKMRFGLTTINNKTFGPFLGGLTPHYPMTSAIKVLQDGGGLYALECRGSHYVVLVVEVDGDFQLVQTKEGLRAMFAPVDSAEEALSIAHLEEGGLPNTVFEDEEAFHATVQDMEHVSANPDGTYIVELINTDPCYWHGERFRSTYVVDKAGNVRKTGTEQLLQLSR